MAKKKKGKSKGGGQDRQRHQQQQQQHPPPRPPSRSTPSADSPAKKRPRSADAPSEGDAPASVAPYAIQWLEKRKLKIPDGLRSEIGAGSVEEVMRLLPGLRERERRALVRHMEKCIQSKDGTVEKKNELEGSDGEYHIEQPDQDSQKEALQQSGWPANVEFANDYRWDAMVPAALREKYAPSATIRKRAPRLSNRVYFKRITDVDHPAHGEYGLYCALDHAAPGVWLLDYVGHVTPGEDQDKRSDYVSDFGEHSELACDANSYGNEARFLNDFRNTGKHPNVEFNLRRDKHGELRQGVYVKQKKDAREEGFDGVRKDEELLVSYGKSYWRSRVGNLTDFVWRIPGHPMPEGGKPAATGHERREC